MCVCVCVHVCLSAIATSIPHAYASSYIVHVPVYGSARLLIKAKGGPSTVGSGVMIIMVRENKRLSTHSAFIGRQ